MTLEKLGRLCLQQLEQDVDSEVLAESIFDLKDNDTYTEYILNMYHSLYMAFVRFASSYKLPLKSVEFGEGNTILDLTKTTKKGQKKALFKKIKQVIAYENEELVDDNIEYMVIGTTIRIKRANPKYQYICIYHPTILDLEEYVDNIKINSEWELELEELGIPDDLAIISKYLVYADMKYEENPSSANVARNYFETYLGQYEAQELEYIQTQYKSREWKDVYGQEGNSDYYDNDDFMLGD